MNKSVQATLLASAMTFSIGALAQATTPDGKTSTPDSTMQTSHDAAKHHKSHSTMGKSKSNSSTSSMSKPAPDVVNQTTPDGKNKTPDATPVTK